jgi:membrane protein DedA with SNARE-associated domain
MTEKAKEILKIISIPLALLAVSLMVHGLWVLFKLPQGDALTAAVQDFFKRYGLWLLFMSAILEGMLILGQYYPGGIMIFLGVVSAGHNILRVILVVSVVSLAFFIGYTIDYLMGKYGWYKLFLKFGLQKTLDNAKTKVARKELRAILASYWEPNLASVTATAAGILQIPFFRFSAYSAIGIVVWNTLWGTLVAILGVRVFSLFGIKYAFIVVFIWVSIIIAKHYLYDKKKVLSIP